METVTTKPRDQEQTKTKPREAHSLCNLKYNKSDEELERESKKRKRKSQLSISSTTSDIEYQDSVSKENMGENSKIAEMIQVMKEVLRDKDVSDSLVSQFREECKSLIEETRKEIIEIVDEKIEVVEMAASTQNDRIKALEKWADNADQEARSMNLIIRGLTTTNSQTEEELITHVATTLSRKLDAKILPNDIRFVIRLGKDKNDNNTRPIKVAFHERRAREYIYKKRGMLKGTNIWLCDDLTAKRSKLAYSARQSAKQKEAFKTWT